MAKRPSSAEAFSLRVMAQDAARRMRAEHGYTQQQLAEILCTSQQVVSLIERAKPRAPYGVMRKLIMIVGVQ